jgi:hypothetical protein
MKKLLSIIVMLSGLAATVCGFVGTDASRYDVILKRKPFGDAPAEALPDPIKRTSPRDSYIKHYRMVALTKSGLGVRVGLVDLKSKPMRSFFMYVGEVDNGMSLVRADYDDEKAWFLKDGEGAELTMTGGTSTGGRKPVAATGDGRDAERKAIFNRIAARRGRSSSSARKIPFTGLTKKDGNALRKAGLIAPPRAPRNVISGAKKPPIPLTKEEKRARLRNYNMDLIRAGGKDGPPLPIELTSEEDAKLVEEGVLPPQ